MSKIGRAIGKKREAAGAADCNVVANMKLVNQSVSIWADERDCPLCPLNRVKAGVAVRIKQLCASPEVARRLRETGFGEDQIIKPLAARPTSSVWCATRPTLNRKGIAMTLENAIRVLAGTLVLTSLALAHWVNPWWLFLAAFVGLNLIQSAFTGFCPAEIILKRFGVGGARCSRERTANVPVS